MSTGAEIEHSEPQPTGFALLKSFTLDVIQEVGKDNLPRLASSFTFFALLSLAPFLVLAVTAGALILGRSETAQHLLQQAAHVGGPAVKDYLQQVIQSSQHRAPGIVATVLSLLVTFYSASNLFLQLDDAVNTIWGIQLRGTFLRRFIRTRLLAFFSVLLFGGAFVAWLVLDSVMAYIERSAGTADRYALISMGGSVVFLTLVFSLTMRGLPKGRLTWRDTWPGAFVAAAGVALSKTLLSIYFLQSAGVYAAAGGVVVLMLWCYYTTMIYFVGVEVTFVYAHEYGSLQGAGRKFGRQKGEEKDLSDE